MCIDINDVAKIRKLLRIKGYVCDLMADVSVSNLKGDVLNPSLVNSTVHATEMEQEYLSRFTPYPSIRSVRKTDTDPYERKLATEINFK